MKRQRLTVEIIRIS